MNFNRNSGANCYCNKNRQFCRNLQSQITTENKTNEPASNQQNKNANNTDLLVNINNVHIYIYCECIFEPATTCSVWYFVSVRWPVTRGVHCLHWCNLCCIKTDQITEPNSFLRKITVKQKVNHQNRMTEIEASSNQPPITPVSEMDEDLDNVSLSSFGSFDDSFQFAGEYRPSCDDLAAFSFSAVSPSGRSQSPMGNGPLSLLNLSISPISSLSDLTDDPDDDGHIYGDDGDVARMRDIDRTASTSTPDDEDSDRISLDEINAQINTPPQSAISQRYSTKRLNLETIFEDVFLETQPKKRKFDSWGIRSISQTTVERINTYVMDQRQKNEMSNDPNRLCDMFENKIDIS